MSLNSDMNREANIASASAPRGQARLLQSFQQATQAFVEAESDEEGAAFQGIRDAFGEMANELQATSQELAAIRQAREALQLQVDQAAGAGPAGAAEKSTVLVSSGLQPLPAIGKALFRSNSDRVY